MRCKTLFIDLDETLYPSASGVWDAIADRIDRYMLEVLRFHPEEIRPMRSQLFKQYGTTLKGLQTVCQIDAHDFLQFVHDVPVRELLAPNPRLRGVLQTYPQRKIIFTNADRPHAERVINALDLDGCFDEIIDIHDIAPYCKPDPAAFQVALQKAGNLSAGECALIDDKLPNLSAARRLGFSTILVGSNGASPNCDASIAVLEDLPLVLDPHLNGSHANSGTRRSQ